MSEVEPGSGDNDLSAAEPRGPAHDFSAVQGFQLVGADDQGGGDPAWPDALRLELEARAARFHQAVDSAIVLSNDGVIRWLGDPVARLSVGSDALNPGALILADPSLPEAARETVRTRVELWIAAMTRRILAPVFALEALQEGSETIRDLAHKLARSLGILEREPIRVEIRALSQNDRAELRKQGVRFGAHYLFVPALIKPAARTLALHLWSLRAPGEANELLRALAPIAASGRTSLARDTGISHEGYRVAGYRPCGERVVRVDIIERLGGMIRAAIAGEPPGVAPEGPIRPEGGPEKRPASKGFVVNGQMTSLTGCSGEQFASILRSMGFRPVEVKRSEFFGAPAAQSREQPAPLAPKGAQEPACDPPPAQETGEEAAAGDMPPAQETGEEAAAGDMPPAQETGEEAVAGDMPPAQETGEEAAASDPPPAQETGDEAAADDMLLAQEASDEAAADDMLLAQEASDEASTSDPPLAQEAIEEATASDPVPASASIADVAPLDGVPSPASADPPGFGAPEANGAEEGAFSQTSAPGGAENSDAEMIVVWRPDHRRTAPHRRSTRSNPSRSATPRRSGADDQAPVRPAEGERPKKRRPDAGKGGWGRSPGADQPGLEASEKHRQRAGDRDMRLNPAAGAQPRAKVDPNSPFAKLLELRPLLEGRANKRP